MDREPRLVFGQVAERYDRVRPSYPNALVDEVIALAGRERALEVGAGTGKATLMFAQRGVAVHAVEPSAEMASAVGLEDPRTRVYQWDAEYTAQRYVEFVANSEKP